MIQTANQMPSARWGKAHAATRPRVLVGPSAVGPTETETVALNGVDGRFPPHGDGRSGPSRCSPASGPGRARDRGLGRPPVPGAAAGPTAPWGDAGSEGRHCRFLCTDPPLANLPTASNRRMLSCLNVFFFLIRRRIVFDKV